MVRIPQRVQAFNHHPFAGGKGVSLYLGVGTTPGVDPGAESIRYRSLRLIPQPRRDRYKRSPLFVRGSGFDYGNGVRKTAAVAVAKHPATSIDYTLPPGLAGYVVWLQICVHDQHVENLTNYRPQRLVVDDELNVDDTILGRGKLLSIEKRDGGGVLFRFQYDRSRDGIPPTEFVATKITGAGTIADVTVEYTGPYPMEPGGKSLYELETPTLVDGEDYVYQILARNGAVTLALVGNVDDESPDIEFTADGSGPPAPSNLRITAN